MYASKQNMDDLSLFLLLIGALMLINGRRRLWKLRFRHQEEMRSTLEEKHEAKLATLRVGVDAAVKQTEQLLKDRIAQDRAVTMQRAEARRKAAGDKDDWSVFAEERNYE